MDASDAPSTKPRPVRGFVVSTRAWRIFKASLYALLMGNVALYALQGTGAETIDTAAWLVLLVLLEWETGGWSLTSRTRAAVHGIRAIASFAVLWACAVYALDREWLDFANAAAWLGAVLMLELEVRIPPRRAHLHRVRRVATWILYAALGGFAAAWWLQGLGGVDGAMLDAWDATLWLLAFVAIELNVFGWRSVRLKQA